MGKVKISKLEGKNWKEKFNNMKLSSKISLAVGTLLTGMLILLIAVSIVTASNALYKSINGELEGIALENGMIIQDIVDEAMSSASNLCDYINYQFEIFEGHDGRVEPSIVFDADLQSYNADMEDYMVNSAWATVAGNQYISAMAVGFEPDVFDSAVRDYSIYITEENAANKTVDTLDSYEEYSNEEYYKQVLQTKEYYFTDPYEYDGQMLVTASYPILFNGEVQGAVMVDIVLDKFAVIDKVNETYPTLYGNIITKEGIYIYDVDGIQWSGTDMAPYFYHSSEYDAMMEKMQLSDAFMIETHREDGRAVRRYCYPVSLGNDLWWSQSIIDASDASKDVLRLVLIMSILSIVVLAVIIIAMTRLVRKYLLPLAEVEDAAKRLSVGDMDIDITYSSKDEIGALSDNMRNTCIFIKQVIHDAKNLLEGMAEGDFTVRTSCESAYIGEFEGLLLSMRQLNRKLSTTLNQIHDASDQVAAGSSNMAEAAQNLAEGATEQAGAVEELLATVTTLTEGISQSSEGVAEAHRVSTLYAEKADKSGEEMRLLVDSMSRITETSKKIESIIADIEEIASQTNLLSLNASIEAARAGEAGRGFAVVADQIGKLADESARSAVHTRELIMSSINEITEGTRIAGETAETINELVDGINILAKAAEDVSGQMVIQAESMKQAEAGVNQISEVVEANSASAEESSATSEELSAQAISLDELVKLFKIE